MAAHARTGAHDFGDDVGLTKSVKAFVWHIRIASDDGTVDGLDHRFQMEIRHGNRIQIQKVRH